jgi:hypothetical protein
MLDHVIASWQKSGFSKVLVAEHALDHALPTGAARRVVGDTAITVYRTAL